MASRPSLERLSALDRAFLTIESAAHPMHVGAVAIFEGGGLVAPDGALDVAALKRVIAARLPYLPRFRQRVRHVPFLGAVWVRDPRFRLEHHVHHVALPRPGSRAQLDELGGRIFAQRLDRARPLWEMWLVEGLEAGRFAIVIKAHHAMVDGIAAMAMLGALLSFGSAPVPPELPPDEPVVEPEPREIARALLAQRLERLQALRRRASSLADATERSRLSATLGGVVELVSGLLRRDHAAPTALNPRRTGPYRVFSGVRMPLEPLKEVRRAWGGTLNDVALSIAVGALARHLERRGQAPRANDTLRALVPVSLRPKGTTVSAGNDVAMLLAVLPVGERDVRARHDAVVRTTQHMKASSHEADAVELVENLGEMGPADLLGALFDAALHLRPFEVVVTNVPGPPVDLFFGPARLAELLPLVPLFAGQSLAIAVATYAGSFFVGVNADPDAVPDLAFLLRDVEASAEELVRAALGRGLSATPVAAAAGGEARGDT